MPVNQANLSVEGDCHNLFLSARCNISYITMGYIQIKGIAYFVIFLDSTLHMIKMLTMFLVRYWLLPSSVGMVIVHFRYIWQLITNNKRENNHLSPAFRAAARAVYVELIPRPICGGLGANSSEAPRTTYIAFAFYYSVSSS